MNIGGFDENRVEAGAHRRAPEYQATYRKDREEDVDKDVDEDDAVERLVGIEAADEHEDGEARGGGGEVVAALRGDEDNLVAHGGHADFYVPEVPPEEAFVRQVL